MKKKFFFICFIILFGINANATNLSLYRWYCWIDHKDGCIYVSDVTVKKEFRESFVRYEDIIDLYAPDADIVNDKSVTVNVHKKGYNVLNTISEPDTYHDYRGCCTHHGGMSGCVNGKVKCYDGTFSDSCECEK